MIIDQTRFYNFNTLQSLYGINTNDFLKYHQIISNIPERWKLLLKGETAVEQGIDQRQTNIDIISLKHNIDKTLYSTQLKEKKIKIRSKMDKRFPKL